MHNRPRHWAWPSAKVVHAVFYNFADDEVARGGLVDTADGFTDAGRETNERIEALTDDLAAPAYDVLSADELDELTAGLEPIAAAIQTR